MRASVIIPTFNRRNLVVRTLASLAQQNIPTDSLEVIVVVDGSVDGTSCVVRELLTPHDWRVVEQQNRGPAAARNAGAETSSGEILIFVDDDMECAPELVREHLAFQAKQPGSVGMGAIHSSKQSASSIAAAYFDRELGAYLRQRNADAVPEGIWSFANTSIRREDFVRVGGFDENFQMREDAELGARLASSGLRARFVPEAIAYQSFDKNAEDLVRDAEMFADADQQFMRKHPCVAPHGFLRRLEQDSRWKRRVRDWLASHQGGADVLLGTMCAIGERYSGVSVIRSVAVRALQIRCGLHWYRRILEIEPQAIRQSGIEPK